MPRYAIIVDRLSDWKGPTEGLNLISANAFLTNNTKDKHSPARVINLCRRYEYLSAGYYCSLLAEARGQTPMPTVADVLSLQRKNLYDFAVPELNAILNRTIKRMVAEVPTEAFLLTVFFGKPDNEHFKRLAAECFDTFRYPILQLDIEPDDKRWKIIAIRPLGLHHVPEDLAPMFYDALQAYTRTRKELSGGRPPALYNLAILMDPEEALPPSYMPTFNKFKRIGQGLRVDVELITKKDYRRLPEFDALFIRTNTSIDHYTYQFSRKAEQEGLAVIDDPTSILRCTNKVYLHELLQRHGLPMPKTRVLNRLDFGPDIVPPLEEELGYPIVLKIPDGSFSRGMHKAENREQLLEGGADLLKHSRLILAQEYVYTPYDWRVGVLNGEPLFVCQYMMSRNHWQIVNHSKDGTFKQGAWKTFAVEDAPTEVVEIGCKAARLIGDGLYGVDLKQTDKGLMIIEVNDNPSLETQVEDKVLKDELYERILKEFIRRIDAKK